MPRLIDAYLSEFDRHLAFDRRLARRVRAEVGSHLAEALEHETSEAEAVARFGDSKQLAKAFVESALPGRLQFAALSLVIMAAMTLAMMRLRSVWFDLSAYQHGLSNYLATVDRIGFLLGFAMAGYAWWTVRRSQLHAERAILSIHCAMLSFVVSIVASLARALLVAESDSLIWLTGGLECIGLIAIYWQLRLTYRHAMIAHSQI